MGCSSSQEAEPQQSAPTKKAVQGAGTSAKSADAKANARLAQITPNEDVGKLLRTVPLLSKLSDAERAKLGGAVTEKSFQDGVPIITQGEPGHGFYIIRRGQCAVVRTDE